MRVIKFLGTDFSNESDLFNARPSTPQRTGAALNKFEAAKAGTGLIGFHDKRGVERKNIDRPAAYFNKKTGTIFINRKNNAGLYIKSSNGRFNRVPPSDLNDCQEGAASALKFTPRGLENLRKKYHDEIYGTAAFIYAIFNFTHEYKQSKDMAEYPEQFPYFKNEKFLIVPNAPSYTPSDGSDLRHPTAQKLKDEGIILCGWFMHQGMSCLQTEKSKKLLDELSDDRTGGEKTVLEELKEHYTASGQELYYKWDNSRRDSRTIAEIEKDGGEYLASILDLNKNHLPMLRSLREKTLKHLKHNYRVDEDDDVSMYFHFPYIDSTVTLHLHIRVNHGLHPSEKEYGFTLDEIIDGLSSGKSIDDLVLAHQDKNGHFYCMHEKRGFYRGVEGIEIAHNVENIFKLEKDGVLPIPANEW